MGLHRILVPLDGSAFAERALPVAIDVAGRCGACLDLVLVDEPRPPIAPIAMAPAPLVVAAPTGVLEAESNEARREGHTHYVQQTAARVKAANDGLVAEGTVLSGDAAATLIAHIEQEPRPDLVVMSTHGLGGLTRLYIGSVADAVVRRVTVPVLLAKPPEDGVGPRDGPPPFRRVLVPLDGSARSEAVLKSAVEVAGRSGVEYVLATVSEPLTALSATHLAAPDGDQPESSGSDGYLRGVASLMNLDGFATDTRTLVHTDVARAILDLATEIDADLIALTTHGRGGWRRVLLGSTADKVIRGHGRCTLVIRRSSDATE